MGVAKMKFGYGWMATVLLALLVLGGCGGGMKAVKYSHITKAGLQELKSYQWAKADGLYRQDPMLEVNVQILADRDLEQKGLIKKGEKADLLIWVGYEYDYDNYSNKLRMLSLSMARADNKELVWRGTAVGEIRTDVTTNDLKMALEGMLTKFPQ